eukprot:965896-Amphidinium_carterae.2
MCTCSVRYGGEGRLGHVATGSGSCLWLSTRVIPMSWINAVGIVQDFHRELLLREQDGVVTGFCRRLQTTEWCQMWQVCIDDFDLAELFPASGLSSAGTVSKAQAQALEAYRAWSAPRSDLNACFGGHSIWACP